MTRFPDAPRQYDAIWASNLMRGLQTALDRLEQPANKQIEGEKESVYTIEDQTVNRSLDKNSDIDDIRNVLMTLITDLRQRGILR